MPSETDSPSQRNSIDISPNGASIDALADNRETSSISTIEVEVKTESGWLVFIVSYMKKLLYRFISQETLQEYGELTETRIYLLAAIAYAALFIIVIEPLSCIIVESRPVRYKVQSYFFRPFEFLLENAFHRIFDIQVFGEQNFNMHTLTVIMANHQGILDYATLIVLCRKAGIIDSSYFFVFKHCVRLPSLRVCYNMWRMQTNWRVPEISLADTFSPVLESPWINEGGKSIIIFPEVMCWSATNMLEDRGECVNQGCPKLNELLYPRFNAFVQAVTYLRDHPLADIYDVTILYTCEGQSGMPTFKQLLLSNQRWKIQVHVKKYPASSIPRREKHLIRWLEKEWFRKDSLISDLKLKSQQRA